jgi:hypothetical protein
MRKLWIAVVAGVVAAVSVAGVASAENTYEVDIASGGPGMTPGSPSKPFPSFLNFGYEVDDTQDLRPSVINQYFIAAEGIKYFPDARPTCTFAQADEAPAFDRACRKAIVGSGSIANEFGASADRTQKGPCDVKLTLINISTGSDGATTRQIRREGGMAIRIDSIQGRCPIPVHGALAAPMYDIRLGGVPTSELRFRVPDTLTHPAPAVDNSVIDVVSRVRRVTGRVKVRGKTRRVGFASAVGRKGRQRTVRVTFVDETNRRFTATTTYPR